MTSNLMAITITFAVVIGVLTVIIGILVKVLGFPHQFMKNYRKKSTDGLSTIFILLAFSVLYFSSLLLLYLLSYYF